VRTTHGIDDGELALRAARGEEGAFGALLERHAEGAQRLARTVLPETADAEDAVQEGAIAAWRALARFDPARPFRPWFFAIVLNAARDLGRRQRVRQGEPVMGDHPSTAAGPDRETERTLMRARLRAALAGLPERQRVAVTLFDGEGWTHAEIADLIGAPVGTVRSDVFHGRRTLREALADYREELR
jgi:RNA polymerase sigma-70 factor (ECF subfamily)